MFEGKRWRDNRAPRVLFRVLEDRYDGAQARSKSRNEPVCVEHDIEHLFSILPLTRHDHLIRIALLGEE
jgi:hypothetical protein